MKWNNFCNFSSNFLLFYEGTRSTFCSIFFALLWALDLEYMFEVGRDLQIFLDFFGLVSGYNDCDYNKANHTHNYHHFQVLQPEFPLEFAGLLFKL